ncbi:MAG: methyltransferase domain-containing protein [Planctomycetota bacterium]
MFDLRCTVRKCTNSLALSDAGLTCEAGHHFDRAKEGYWNLTQPQDKKSSNPGDNREAVLARHRWLERGHAKGLIESLRVWVPDAPQVRILDLGCGDGTFGPSLFPEHADTYCGIDLSKPAIKLAARRWPEATWVLANADRGLPVADASVECLLSLFGRRPVSEISRVLKPGGICIVAVPGEEDLIELREQVQKEGRLRSRIDAIIEEMGSEGLSCDAKRLWKTQVDIGPDEIADALAMTYRAVRHSEKSLVPAIGAANVTLAADLLLFTGRG